MSFAGEAKKDGAELRVDQIKPKDVGGNATIANGLTLCSQHYLMNQRVGLTETAKEMFNRLHKLAIMEKNEDIQDFCSDVLQTYEDHDINGHIEWVK